ncbi:MAG: hypothetical protein ACYTFQ_30710 [Planctomycetota bacterium]|jgi:hypothetical protein
MNETRILLQAYYEALYQRLEAEKPLLAAKIDELLAQEVEAKRKGTEVLTTRSSLRTKMRAWPSSMSG